MKIKFIIFSIILLFSTTAFSQSGGTISSSFYNGYEYVSKFRFEELKNTPSWNPEKEDSIPLSVQKAIEIARKNIKRFTITENDKWDLSSISLREYGKDKWAYSISFFCGREECSANPSIMGFFVKMDGTIIEPTVIPSKSKTPTFNFDCNKGLRYSYNTKENKYEVKITAEDTKNAPLWNPEDEAMPLLSFQNATEIGRENLRQSITGDDKWNVNEIKLSIVGLNKWVYAIGFECFQESCNFSGDSYRFYIKMDGTVVKPTITPVNNVKSKIQ